jgi:hypothetical protein
MTTNQEHKSAPDADPGTGGLTRRRILRSGAAGLVVAGAAAVGLAEGTAHGAAGGQPMSVGRVAGLDWSGWAPVAPGLTTQQPLACTQSFVGGVAAVWLFATGDDSRIYANRTTDNTNWVGWSEVPGGGFTNNAPSAGVGPNGELVLAVTGTDNAIYINSTADGSNWTGWIFAGGASFVPPLVGLPRGNLYAVGTDEQIYRNSTDLHTFGGWNLLPGNGFTDTGMSMEYSNFAGVGGVFALYVKGLDSRIYYNTVDVNGTLDRSGVGRWTEVDGGGLTDSAPAATATPGTDLIDTHLFVKGFQGQRVYVNRADRLRFGSWAEVPGGGLTNLAPCATTSRFGFLDGPLMLFVVGLDGRPWLNKGA